MTRRVVGLDLSLTSTGIAVIVESSRGHRLVTDLVRSKPIKTGTDPAGKPRETLLDRHQRMRELAADILHHAALAHLVVIEGLIASPARSRGVQDRPALWWQVVSGLCARHVPVAVCAPAAMKSRIVGPRPKNSGPVDKVQVALAVAKLWPEADLGNADTADAAGLAHLGAVALGWDITTLERHRDVKWTEWPVFGIDDPEPEPAPVRSPLPRAPGAAESPAEPLDPAGRCLAAPAPRNGGDAVNGRPIRGVPAPPDLWDGALLPLDALSPLDLTDPSTLGSPQC